MGTGSDAAGPAASEVAASSAPSPADSPMPAPRPAPARPQPLELDREAPSKGIRGAGGRGDD
eukprot:16435126-Heterocapsa_arctica.AAC.1